MEDHHDEIWELRMNNKTSVCYICWFGSTIRKICKYKFIPEYKYHTSLWCNKLLLLYKNNWRHFKRIIENKPLNIRGDSNCNKGDVAKKCMLKIFQVAKKFKM